MSRARSTTAIVTFDGTDISEDISKYLESITYIDFEEDKADDLQIKLQDRPRIWLLSWIQQMMEASVTDAAQTETAAAATTQKYTVTAQSCLILREGPSTSTARLNCFAFGTEIDVADDSGSWFQVNAGGQSGYMYSGYLTPAQTEQSADANAATTAAPVATAQPGFKITASFQRSGWNDGNSDFLDCGQFELDTIQCQGPPDSVTLKATALPYSSSARQTLKDKTWEAVKLSMIGAEIAAAAGMTCMFLSQTDITYTHIEQKQEADISFLSGLCHDAGLSLKVNNNIIIIFDQITYESASPIATIVKGDGSYTQHNLSTAKASVQYQSCRVSYVTPEGQLIEGIAKLTDYDPEAKGNQQLEITAKVADIAEAQVLAQKHLRLHNKYQMTAQFQMQGNPDMAAGVCVQLSGWGPWSGKYIISQSRHQLSRSTGYTTTITLRRVLGGY